ncbi:MAG: hypothetical protein HYZ62_01875 [Candidatus Andersenbacteria bacterium]|nr:hypothetical protein [Candidatus Andersenbacteria bacterium]
MALSEEAIQDQIRSWIESPGIQSALLVTGTDSVHLQNIITFACQATACVAAYKPCGKCAGCAQAVAGTYPDIAVARGEEKTISLKEIRALLTSSQTTPLRGKRLLVIAETEKVSPPAASALLKSLEEPGEHTRWLLVTAYKKRMLPTILSRCTVLQLPQKKAKTQPSAVLPAFNRAKAEPFREEDLCAVAAFLREHVRRQGSSSAALKSLMRLRDYYKIRAQAGNTKLAREVLLSTLDELYITSQKKLLPGGPHHGR